MYIADLVHFHDESERDYYAVLGRYISAWGGFENGLYQLLLTTGGTYRRILEQKGEAALPPEFKAGFMPFGAKIANLRKCLEACPSLWQPQDHVLDLIAWAEKEVVARHHLIHGVDQLFEKRTPFTTYMYKGESSDPSSSSIADGMDFSIESLVRRYDEVGNSCMNLAILHVELTDAIKRIVPNW